MLIDLVIGTVVNVELLDELLDVVIVTAGTVKAINALGFFKSM